MQPLTQASPSLPHQSFALFPLLALSLVGCAGQLDPAPFDDPESCGRDVQEDILIPRCALSGCHRPGEPPAGLEYVTGGLAERLLDVQATTCPDQPLIDPDDPDASHLLMRVSESPTCGETAIARMPLLGPPLDERELACLRAWVRARAADAREQP